MNNNRVDSIEAAAPFIDRNIDWRAVRDCHAAPANANRIAAYRDRLAASLDPLGEPDVLAGRQLVGLRVQAEIRRRDRLLRLHRRPAPCSVVTANMAHQGPCYLVQLIQAGQP